MRELSHSLHLFTEALQRGDPVYLTSLGKWKIETPFVEWIRRVARQEVDAHVELIQCFNVLLDELEVVPVNFSQIPGVVVSQPADFHGYLSAAQSLRNYVNRFEHPSLNPLIIDLRIKTLALLYRLEEENGGLHLSNKGGDFFLTFLTHAESWKKQQKVFWNSELTEEESKQLALAGKYVDFTKMMLENSELRESFFLWVLRDGLPVDVFIQFPNLKKKIIENNLCGRIGRMGHGVLKLRKTDLGALPLSLQKTVSLPFEGQDISILDENTEVVFKGNYKIKMKQVFQVFRDKAKDLGNFEMFAQGISNWNSNCMGWWNNNLRAYELVDVDVPDWWRQLPVLEVLTIAEASRRYGMELDGKKWILAAKSSRESKNLDYDRSHAYFEMAISSPDHEFYVIYTFGKAAINLPHTAWDRLFLFGAHIPATVVYPDETMFFTHRQQLGYSFILSEEEGVRLMNAFKEDILRARTGNMVFQVEAENCGKWIQNHLEEHLGKERVPNLYRLPLLEAEGHGFLSEVFQFFQALPRFCRNRLFILIHYPLGAWRGRWVIDKQGQKVWKSLLSSSFWKDTITYIPAYLHKQHETGVFSDDPTSHNVWVEGTPLVGQKNVEVSPEAVRLFEESNYTETDSKNEF